MSVISAHVQDADTHSWARRQRAYSTDLLPARVVVELSTGADVARLNAGILLQHCRGAEVVGEEGPGDAGGHAGVEEPSLIDLLHHACNGLFRQPYNTLGCLVK